LAPTNKKKPEKFIQPLIVVIVLLCVSAIYYFSQRNDESVPVGDMDREEIAILWAKWAPADYLQELSRDFTKETGIGVRIIQESWGTWQGIFFDEMRRKGRAYDMVIGDSQWLGKGATRGHYIELTKWMNEHGVINSMTPAAITGYSEFPKGSKHYWAVPVEGDAMGFSYRKDLFENPLEQQAFRTRYGYALAVPNTWNQLRDIAEFFYRPEEDLYGVLIWVEPRYDGITMGIDSLIWAWGADLGTESSYRVKGILNSKEGVDALSFYKELNRFNNPEWSNHYLDSDANSNQPMMDGKVAMSMGYFAINPELLDSQKNPHAKQMGFFANPAGPKSRVSSLGGQGISIVSYSKKKELSLQFLEWFIRDDVQERWAELGGLSCNRKVLNSEKFLDASPINKPYKESIEMVRDFWAVPEYTELLAVSQKYWSAYVTENSLTAEEAMDKVAEEWEEIFEYAGYYKE
jgi:multiple sugar transport system substrate-binding protein